MFLIEGAFGKAVGVVGDAEDEKGCFHVFEVVGNGVAGDFCAAGFEDVGEAGLPGGLHDAFSEFLADEVECGWGAQAEACGDVADEDFLDKACDPFAFVLHVECLCEATVGEVFIEVLPDCVLEGGVCPVLVEGDAFVGEVFPEGEGGDGSCNESATEGGVDFAAEHAGVAAGDEEGVAVVCQSAGEFFPSIDDLYFVEVDAGCAVEEFGIGFEDEVEVLQGDACKTVVFEVDVEDVLGFGCALSDEVLDVFEECVGFACSSESNEDVVAVFIKGGMALDERDARDSCLLFKDDVFDECFVHDCPLCFL